MVSIQSKLSGGRSSEYLKINIYPKETYYNILHFELIELLFYMPNLSTFATFTPIPNICYIYLINYNT